MGNYVNTGAKGAAGELRVAVDLLARGYQVFRNMTPHGVDLVAYDLGQNQLFKVEVRTHVYRTEEGIVLLNTQEEATDRDVFGFAIPGEAVFYYPWGVITGTLGKP